MQIEVLIKDEKANFFLEFLESLKDNVVEDFFVKDNEEKEILEILNNRSNEDKEISHSKIIEIEIWKRK